MLGIAAAALAIMLPLFLHSRDVPESPPRVVPSVDLSRFAGRWYEVARLPNPFQEDCAGEVSVDYTRRENGDLQVVNRCRTKSGEMEEVQGVARPADPQGPKSKLKVRFAPSFLSFLPFVWGDYWILDLAPDYSYAVVGGPQRKHLWILSRTPAMDADVYEKIVDRLAKEGYQVSRLIQTDHTLGVER
jgi:apolipoprotein D and lipocalin family protein